ncbi:MAG: RagB/SusD family nutrient uptake outer membrane protein [Chitinophagaceae bacterium]|nr:RagB/SusD family nutrient uptake outer membrane protein [Chitinophagaceae bacterium]
MTRIYNCIILLLLITGFSNCEKKLDLEDPSSISSKEVWNDPTLANAYLMNIYNNLMPNMPVGTGSNSDESSPYIFVMADWLRGTATVNTWNYFDYGNVRSLNILLSSIDGGTIGAADKDVIKAQAHFWRAWVYYKMVQAYGGVPLVMDVQDLSEGDALFKPRNKTSECITQIIADLDSAIDKLPVSWSGTDAGRIDKEAALAFKGRALLMYGSPLFNPGNDAARWQAAYDANKAAVDACNAAGKGLHPDVNAMWYDNIVSNPEAIMYKQYKYPGNTYYVGGIRPTNYSFNNWSQDHASLELVNAFPMKDGSAWNPATMNYDTLFRSRDARFYATVAYNGSNMGLKDMVAAGANLWSWHGSSNIPEGSLFSATSFYRQKAQDKTLTKSTTYDATVPWMEIRYAEVYMNYGEAANEVGKPAEALKVLYDIRARAKILPGADMHYGITAASQAEIREAYLKERQVEFAFEDKRWTDLRRLRRFDILNNIKRRHGLYITIHPDQLANFPGGNGPVKMEDINQIYNIFDYDVKEVDNQDMDVKDIYYFYPIPQSQLDQNSKLQQNKGWNGGTFDPLL